MERMCNCWAIPVAYMSRESNLANLQAADKFHAESRMNPRAWCIASVFDRHHEVYDPRLFWTFDDPIAEDELQEATIVDMQIKSGLITRNQATQDTPWPAVPEGDDLFMPGTQKTSDDGRRTEAGLKAQAEGLKMDGRRVKNDAKASKASRSGKQPRPRKIRLRNGRLCELTNSWRR